MTSCPRREAPRNRPRFNYKKKALGALELGQRDVPEAVIDHLPENDPRQIRVTLAGKRHTGSIERLDVPWTFPDTTG